MKTQVLQFSVLPVQSMNLPSQEIGGYRRDEKIVPSPKKITVFLRESTVLETLPNDHCNKLWHHVQVYKDFRYL